MRELIVAVALAVSAFTPSVPGNAPQVLSDDDPPTVTRDDIDFRREFGLSVDVDALVQLVKSGSANYTFGTPLSEFEASDLNDRIALRQASEPVVRLVMDNSSSLGGLFFTQDTGRLELHVVATDRTPAGMLDGVEALAPKDLVVAIESAPNTWDDLLGAQKVLASQSDELGIRELWPDPVHNIIHVVTTTDGLAQVIRDKVTVPVEISVGTGIETTACTSYTNCTPYRGGLKVESPSLLCTWGFYSRSLAGGAPRYAFTAGHCGLLGDSLKHNGVVFTSSSGVVSNTYDLGANTDAMMAHVQGSPNAVSPFNTIFISTSIPNRSITSSRATSSQAVGDNVCFVGFVSTSKCGQIEVTNITGTLGRAADGKTITGEHLIRMSRVAAGGDSGGPAYVSSIALGIVTGVDSGGGNRMIYSPIRDAETDLNAAICITSSC